KRLILPGIILVVLGVLFFAYTDSSLLWQSAESPTTPIQTVTTGVVVENPSQSATVTTCGSGAAINSSGRCVVVSPAAVPPAAAPPVSSAPTSQAAIIAAWNEGLSSTPAPAGQQWRKLSRPRATGERGCTPGETRVNPATGRLQGCGP
ncbi:MAG: hypothetical protein JKX80_02445, partial [Candidatus Pacebacteria bacterium]|nr:hypothetical protein [Candidatus Paceibacterota bacterium]